MKTINDFKLKKQAKRHKKKLKNERKVRCEIKKQDWFKTSFKIAMRTGLEIVFFVFMVLKKKMLWLLAHSKLKQQ